MSDDDSLETDECLLSISMRLSLVTVIWLLLQRTINNDTNPRETFKEYIEQVNEQAFEEIFNLRKKPFKM